MGFVCMSVGAILRCHSDSHLYLLGFFNPYRCDKLQQLKILPLMLNLKKGHRFLIPWDF